MYKDLRSLLILFFFFLNLFKMILFLVCINQMLFNFVAGGEGVRKVIVSVGQNQNPPILLKTGSLVNTLF